MEATAPVRQIPRLRRSRTDRVIGGVCGGLGEYFGIDPLVFRLAFVALALGGGSGVLLYLIAWLAIPEETDESPIVPRDGQPNTVGVVIGSVLILIGTIALANQFAPWFSDLIWPIVLIVLGLVLVFRRWPR